MRHIISLGAGVQSTTMALMAARGLISPMPDAAIFADTQDEPRAVYQHLEWLISQLPFPVHTVTAGKLSQRHLDGYNGARTPFFIKGNGMAKRQCTREFKIRPIRRMTREILGVGPRGRVTQAVISWVGISTDEYLRKKPSGCSFITNRWPLLERGTEMTRAKCEEWLRVNYRISAPKSACKQCPYQGPERLLALKQSEPDSFSALCDYDASLRTPDRIKRWHGELYVHPSCVPLIQIDLESIVSKRELLRAEGLAISRLQYSLFNETFANECEGMCGV